jgi:hypothetical protein
MTHIPLIFVSSLRHVTAIPIAVFDPYRNHGGPHLLHAPEAMAALSSSPPPEAMAPPPAPRVLQAKAALSSPPLEAMAVPFSPTPHSVANREVVRCRGHGGPLLTDAGGHGGPLLAHTATFSALAPARVSSVPRSRLSLLRAGADLLPLRGGAV